MELRIIYQNGEGGIDILIPADCGLSITEIADKDVPSGRPYKIVNVSDLPEDRSQRSNWFVEAEDLTDGVGA